MVALQAQQRSYFKLLAPAETLLTLSFTAVLVTTGWLRLHLLLTEQLLVKLQLDQPKLADVSTQALVQAAPFQTQLTLTLT